MKIIIYTCIIVFLVSCKNPLDKGPFPIDVAKNISRSKELGILMNEFNPQSIRINDTLHFEIISAWTEHNIKTNEVDNIFQQKENWAEGQDWKLNVKNIPGTFGHLSFLVKGDFEKDFQSYNKGWNFYYCQLIHSNDTAISNNFTYFQTYGPLHYDSSTVEIELQFEYYVAPKDTNKYGTWYKFGKFRLTRK